MLRQFVQVRDAVVLVLFLFLILLLVNLVFIKNGMASLFSSFLHQRFDTYVIDIKCCGAHVHCRMDSIVRHVASVFPVLKRS